VGEVRRLLAGAAAAVLHQARCRAAQIIMGSAELTRAMMS
jgi:hypothetical protein